ncbi:MAG: ATP-dependent RNA helicase, ATP-dependent RNA helicase DeaD, partial [Microgenomates group bacterium GW2011_GWC1_40_35]
KEIIETFIKNPVTISVKESDAIENINQDVVKVDRSQNKVDKLHDLLIQDGFNKVLIFGRTKRGVQKLTNELTSRGFKAGVIHGNKSQSQRQKMLGMFRRSQIQILLATDLASRGLDIEDVSHVINYDLPASYDDYIHRIGRTGRANKKGVALQFLLPETVALLKNIKPTNFRIDKTEAIDFTRKFFWLDDDIFASEANTLKQHDNYDSWIVVNLIENPDQLLHLINHKLLYHKYRV